uniref:Uncharacterized protein n=1 Tax=Panagrolaimus sp. ES5 TaxID=591445 RepID=A0AC34GKG9_9BILA
MDFKIFNIISYFFKFNQAPKMKDLWDTLQEQAGPLLTYSGFRHVILVYNYGFTECNIVS